MPQAPSVDLPKRLPLVIMPENRAESTDKDARLVNAYVERSLTGEYSVYRKPGLLRSSRPPAGNAAGEGMYNWLGDVYSVFGTVFYKNGVNTSTVDATGGVYRWSSCLGATPKLQLGNGKKAYNYDDGAGLVEITDGDFPSTFCKGWAFLDATTYVLRPDAGIQGDDLNTPTDWDPLNLIIAQIEPDLGVALAKQLVYVVVLKQWTTEIYYDAANAVGSPLGSVQGAKMPYGCASADSVQSVDDTLLWVTAGREAAPQIAFVENLKLEIVSTKPVERLLAAGNYSLVYSWIYKKDGHSFYILTLKNSNLTLAYDIREKMWAQWTDVNGNYVPIVASAFSGSNTHYVQHESNGRIYTASSEYYTDDGDAIPVDIYTPNFDGGTKRRKVLGIMGILGDKVAGSEILVRVNDFDYDPAKWTNFRKVDMSLTKPQLTDCGTFVRRAHHFHHDKPTAFRIQAVDLQMDLGTI